MKKIGLIIFLLVIVFSVLLVFMFLGREEDLPSGERGISKEVSMQMNTPTEMPFRELTIPYLREQNFVSRLGELKESYSGGNYDGYLTSYESDGLRVNAFLTRPDGEMPKGGWPAIVFIHGYIPPSEYQTNGQAYSGYVDYLANNGFVVFKIDLRGHGTSEGKPGGGYYGADYVRDALSAVAALESSDFVNPKKIGFWGHSMAGNIVLRSLAAMPEMPAAVIWAGAVYSYVDQQKYGISDSSYRPPSNVSMQMNRRQRLYDKVGSPSATSVFWRQMAPTSYLGELRGAIEIHHALDDEVVNIGYSRDLILLLDKTKVAHKLYEYESGGHNISGASFDLAMRRTLDFFKSNLH